MLESHVQQSQESITSEAENMVGATTTILQQHHMSLITSVLRAAVPFWSQSHALDSLKQVPSFGLGVQNSSEYDAARYTQMQSYGLQMFSFILN